VGEQRAVAGVGAVRGHVASEQSEQAILAEVTTLAVLFCAIWFVITLPNLLCLDF